jgi:hypothetical protein
MDTTNSLTDGLNRAWANTVEYTPRIIAFLLILVIGYFVAMALGKVVDKILTRVGFDRAVERGGIKRALSQSGYHVSDILGKIVFYTIFLFVLQMAFDAFGPNSISALLSRVIAFLPNVFVAIVMVVIAASIAAGVAQIVNAALGGLSYGKILATIASGAIVVVGVFMALNQLMIAPAIVNGIFYAMLAIVVGVSIVAIGGGGIQPMRTRWETALNRVEQEVPRVREHVMQQPMKIPVETPPSQGGYVS